MKNGDKPINPVYGATGVPFTEFGKDGGFHGWAKQSDAIVGLTKREYFAAMAMQGLIGMYSRYDGDSPSATSMLCADAVYFADELLKQLGE